MMLILTGCVSTLQVRDLIDLPPPQNVRAMRQHHDITVTWQAPAAGKQLAFSGYLLYFAPRSLATTPLAQLPSPLELAPQLSQFTFAVADSSAIFIHLRTRAGRKHVSLPSLPEVIVPAWREHADVMR